MSGDVDEISRELNRLLKDAKNKEYHDLIYYALGNLSMREGNIDEAIDYMQKSAAASTINTNQKGKSYLVMAEHFFAKFEYRTSQVYYDSAVTFLEKSYCLEIIEFNICSVTRNKDFLLGIDFISVGEVGNYTR